MLRLEPGTCHTIYCSVRTLRPRGGISSGPNRRERRFTKRVLCSGHFDSCHLSQLYLVLQPLRAVDPYPHFIGEETEAQEGSGLDGQSVAKWYLSPSMPDPPIQGVFYHASHPWLGNSWPLREFRNLEMRTHKQKVFQAFRTGLAPSCPNFG